MSFIVVPGINAGVSGSSASRPVLSPEAGAGGSSASLSCPQSAGWCRWQLCILVLSSACRLVPVTALLPVLSSVRRLVPVAALLPVLSSVRRLVPVAALHPCPVLSPQAGTGGSSASPSCPQPGGWCRWQFCISSCPQFAGWCRWLSCIIVLSSVRRLMPVAALHPCPVLSL